MKKKHQTINFANKNKVKINEHDSISVDPKLLFQRLIVMTEVSSITLEEALHYELTSFPPSIFEDVNIMRPANKSALADEVDRIYNNDKLCTPDELPPLVTRFVLDGGSLIQRLPWQKNTTFQHIIDLYAHHIEKKYNKSVTIIFDGYPNKPTIKDQTHQRRKSGTSADIKMALKNELITSKESFLSNMSNKRQFIELLVEKLHKEGHTVICAEADADVLIAQTAVQTTTPTVVIGEDTDLLILLIYHVKSEQIMFYKSEIKGRKIWDIRLIKQRMGKLFKYLLFAHAILGCDTVSRVFGLGKGQALKKLKEPILQKAAEIFLNPETSHKDVEIAGERALLVLYNIKTVQSLDVSRALKFKGKTLSSKSYIDPKYLPPTSSAAKFHSYRAYLQIQQWIAGDCYIDPTKWGWKITNNIMNPIMTDKDPAPENLLKIVRCTCRTDCRSLRCSCRKHGVMCTTACTNCTETCNNIPAIDPSIEDDH